MSRPNPKKSLLFISLLSIIISLFLFIASITPQKQETSNKVHSDQFWKEEYWRNVIEKEGGEEAYQELKRQFANWAYLPTHQALHAFGFALYNKFGQKGSIYCDDYQRFGCFHGVIAAFIANKGLSALEDMDSVCPLNQPSAENRCFHGIGHGLVDYLGKPNLNQALVFCKKINSLTYLGCPQGAIMEYYAPINTKSKTITYHPFDKNSIFGPCEELDEEFQKFCYYFTPSFYWPNYVSSNPPLAEEYCLTIKNNLFKQMCFAGVGSRASNRSNFDLTASQNLCLQMKNESSQIYCLGGVHWNRGSSNQNTLTTKPCSSFGEQASKTCTSISQELNN